MRILFIQVFLVLSVLAFGPHDAFGDQIPSTGNSAQTTIEPNKLSWATASELDNFGYEVFRGLSKSGPFEKINEGIIEGAGTTDIPQQYHYSDADIEPDTVYWYYIESISLLGERRRVTPKYASKPRQAKAHQE